MSELCLLAFLSRSSNLDVIVLFFASVILALWHSLHWLIVPKLWHAMFFFQLMDLPMNRLV